MDFLKDINREQGKMLSDIESMNRHYVKLQDSLYQLIRYNVIEWARLVESHPKAVLLIVETTQIVDEHGRGLSGHNEPIRFTTRHIASGEIWDQLIKPTHSKGVAGTEFHGLSWFDVLDQPKISEAWDSIAAHLADRQVVIFNAQWARDSVKTSYPTRLLDSAYCLHTKAREYYNEFYGCSLEKILGYQGTDKTRGDLRAAPARVVMLDLILHNLANGMEKKPEPEPELTDLDDHPF